MRAAARDRMIRRKKGEANGEKATFASPCCSPALAVIPAAARAEAQAAGLIATRVCALMPEVTEGPYYIDPGLIRHDIREDKAGVPLVMRLQVVTADCVPVADARVDIWHCDAQGNYSGFAGQGSDVAADTQGQTFLRGTQMTDAQGLASFQTIYPGWYRGRTTHIHFKVFLAENTVLTGQIFFPDALSQYLYDHAEGYSREGRRDTVNRNDHIAAEAGEGASAFIREQNAGYEAALVIGIDPATGEPAAGRGGPPPGDAPPEQETGDFDPKALIPGRG